MDQTMNDKVKALVRSRRFWLAVSGLMSVVAANVFDVDEQLVDGLVMVVASWIIGDSLRPTE